MENYIFEFLKLLKSKICIFKYLNSLYLKSVKFKNVLQIKSTYSELLRVPNLEILNFGKMKNSKIPYINTLIFRKFLRYKV